MLAGYGSNPAPTIGEWRLSRIASPQKSSRKRALGWVVLKTVFARVISWPTVDTLLCASRPEKAQPDSQGRERHPEQQGRKISCRRESPRRPGKPTTLIGG